MFRITDLERAGLYLDSSPVCLACQFLNLLVVLQNPARSTCWHQPFVLLPSGPGSDLTQVLCISHMALLNCRYVIRIGFLWAQAQNCTKLTLPVANQIKADLPPVIQPMGVYFTPTPIPPRVFPPLVTPKGPTKPAVTGSSSGAVLASVSPNASKRVASMSG